METDILACLQLWKEELQLPVMTPTMADSIEVALFDDDGVIFGASLPSTYICHFSRAFRKILLVHVFIAGKSSWIKP